MNLHAQFACVLAVVAWHLTVSIANAEAKAFDVGAHSQMFIDRALVASADGVGVLPET